MSASSIALKIVVPRFKGAATKILHPKEPDGMQDYIETVTVHKIVTEFAQECDIIHPVYIH